MSKGNTLCFNSRDLISHLARWEIPLASVGDASPLKEVRISHPERDRYRVAAVISWSRITVWHKAASSNSRTFLNVSFVYFVFPALCSKRTVHSSWGAGRSGALLLNAENLSVPVETSGHPPGQRMALVSLSTPGSWADSSNLRWCPSAGSSHPVQVHNWFAFHIKFRTINDLKSKVSLMTDGEVKCCFVWRLLCYTSSVLQV